MDFVIGPGGHVEVVKNDGINCGCFHRKKWLHPPLQHGCYDIGDKIEARPIAPRFRGTLK